MRQEKNLLFTKEHEWAEIDTTTQTAVIGISHFAQNSLGDIVFLDIPKTGAAIIKDKVLGCIESVKTVSDIYAPLSGTIIEINQQANNSPEIINTDPYDKGWLFKIAYTNPQEIDNLLSFDAYQKLI